MYYCFLPLVIDALDLFEGIMRSLEDSQEAALGRVVGGMSGEAR